MIELLIEKLIQEGKITQEEIDNRVNFLKGNQPLIGDDVLSLKKRQDETENTIMFLLDMTMGGN